MRQHQHMHRGGVKDTGAGASVDPKLEFGERLRAAMVAAGLSPRPSVLHEVFNARYWGRSVTFQAASRWLRGQAIPEHSKMLVLAEVLGMEPEVLRYGEGVRRSLVERRLRWETGVGYLERETFDAFLQLPPEQRYLVRQTIFLFVRANAASLGEVDKGTKGSISTSGLVAGQASLVPAGGAKVRKRPLPPDAVGMPPTASVK